MAFAPRDGIAVLAEAFADDGREGITPGHSHDAGQRVLLKASWKALFPSGVKDEKQKRTGEGKIDGARGCALFRVHGAEDVVAQEDGVEDDKAGRGNEGELPVIEEEQDDPYPHTRANVNELTGELGGIVAPAPDSFDDEQHTEGEYVGEDESQDITGGHIAPLFNI